MCLWPLYPSKFICQLPTTQRIVCAPQPVTHPPNLAQVLLNNKKLWLEYNLSTIGTHSLGATNHSPGLSAQLLPHLCFPTQKVFIPLGDDHGPS